MAKRRVVVVGGGFGGLTLAQELAGADVSVTLVDRTNHHLFQPLLYQVATAGLSPADIASPIRSVLRDAANVRVVLGEVTAVDLRERHVVLGQGDVLAFDHLVLALGLRTNYFGRPDWAKLAVGLKDLDDALEVRRRLLVAFDKVNAHFRELFTLLFDGGSADLQLVESDDPLEAGLDILARPPGKKPQTMTLLSGGEQALTAMSLIFAVFLTNPSPICVLDEVDAPLDDSNVERFCDLLDEMRKKTDTRFVTITHNPITMARMDRLFGVTQAERGISQLVSVDLEQAEKFALAS